MSGKMQIELIRLLCMRLELSAMATLLKTNQTLAVDGKKIYNKFFTICHAVLPLNGFYKGVQA